MTGGSVMKASTVSGTGCWGSEQRGSGRPRAEHPLLDQPAHNFAGGLIHRGGKQQRAARTRLPGLTITRPPVGLTLRAARRSRSGEKGGLLSSRNLAYHDL